MKHRTAIYTVCILLISLFVFLPTVNAAPGDFDTFFSQDGKLVDTLLGNSRDRAQAAAVQADGKIVIAGTLIFGVVGGSNNRFGCGIVRYNTNGSPDTTFDEDGKVYGLIDTGFTCRAVAIQTNGNIIVAGDKNGDFALIRFKSDGSLDTSFGTGGKVVTSNSGYDIINAIAIQTDGKIVAAGVGNTGSNSNFSLARYNPNGSLDATFGSGGKVTTDFSVSIDLAYAVAIQTDGKIVAAGYSFYTTVDEFAIARYNADGSLDTSFDSDGKLTTNLSNSTNSSRAYAVAIQADGKIVASGYGYISDGSGSSSAGFAVARYNSDGSLDTSFDGDGKVSIPIAQFGSGAYSVALQTDGKIVASGYNYSNSAGADFTLVRYNSDGSLDNSFDGDGIATAHILSNDYAYAVALQTDGKIVTAGFSGANYNDDYSIARFNTDGSLDTSFDGDGKTTNDFGYPTTSGARKVAIQADGKIVAAGYSYNGSNDDFVVVRYNLDGSRDTSFDGDGKVITDISTNIWGERANAIAIQADGKIIAAGTTQVSAGNDFALVRYNANGSLDGSFGSGGVVTTTFSTGSYEYVYSLAIQTDGKIVAAGYSYNGSNNDVAIARYNADGSLDTSFDGDGKVITAFSNYEAVYAVKIQSDGKIVAAGSFSQNGTDTDFAVFRYNTDGSLDTSFDGDGRVTTNIFGINEGANAVAIQTDGKIIAAGSGFSGGNTDFALLRYNPNGSLDTSFDGDGKVITGILNNDSLNEVAIQANGKIIAAGYSYNGAHNEGSLVRYNADGSLDGSFGIGGKRTVDMLGGSNDFFYGMAIDLTGRAVMVGETSGSITLARFLGDKPYFDFDGDGKSDISIFRPSAGEWWYLKSSTGGTAAFAFGNSADKLVPADFTGDGKTDIAVFRPSSGEWFILRSDDSSYYSFPFGTSGDIPQVGDFDADGKSDAAVYRPSNSTWFIRRSSDGGTTIEQFGQTGDVPVVADYDGDGKSDIAIYRVSLGEWWMKRSTAGTIAFGFGNSSDKPVQGDYTGDGKADVAIWRPSSGEWFILRSENQSYYSFPFGISTDIPAPGDYDGDGKFDASIFRASNSTWYSQRTTAGTLIQTFGIAGDQPVPNAFVP